MLRLKSRCIGTVAVLLLAAALAMLACQSTGPGLGETVVATCSDDGGELPTFLCPAFPNTNPGLAHPSPQQWDFFAWNSFIAANWPAVVPSGGIAGNGYQRGFADIQDLRQKSFATATSTDLLVWETFKEKRELFQPFLNHDGSYTPQTDRNNPVDPGDWNKDWNYGPLDPSRKKPYHFPPCSVSGEGAGATWRSFAQLGKVDSLDETVEVASEALESDPASQRVQGRVVGPRVWKGLPTQPNPQPVYYEVKLNYDYYNYVRGPNNTNKYYIDANAQSNLPLQLPYRTSASTAPGGPTGLPISVTSYNSSDCIGPTYYDPTTKKPKSGMNPCPAGSIQIKTAWIPLTHGENASQYHTAKAAVYRTQGDKTCIDSGSITYGLVGMHIIQRIHLGDPTHSASPQGGTFIFATWEHIDLNKDPTGFYYSNYYPPPVAAQFNNIPPAGFYPPLTSPLPVKRRFPILSHTASANNTVHQALKRIKSDSVWLNYQLIGVQFLPIKLTTEQPSVPPFPTTLPNQDPNNIGQPTYLANLAVETNDGLQLFRGLPPNVAVKSRRFRQASTGNSSPTAFDRDTPNVAFSPTGDQDAVQGFNMGGCMGCHGVAQLKGYSFSFVLLEGQRGGDVDTEEDFNVAPLPPLNVTAVTPPSGPAAGGTPVTITGTNFLSGATVTFGGTAATSVVVVNSTTITAVTPAKPAGPVAVEVTNPGGKAATLSNGFSYTP